MEHSVLVELERAELVSRSRRLAAASEADARVAAARLEAERIAGEGAAEIARAVAEVRARHAAQGDAAVAAIEDELARLELGTAGQAEPADPRFEAAVDAIVVAVLAEQDA